MAHAEVLLLKPIEGLGGEGDEVKVRAGYARNFLLPRSLAIPVSRANRKQIEALKKSKEVRETKERSHADELKAKIEKISIAIAVKTGEGGKMYGAVTAADLHQRLVEEGVTLDKRKIALKHPIKTLGRHSTRIKLHHDVGVDFEFEVVSENPIEPVESQS